MKYIKFILNSIKLNRKHKICVDCLNKEEFRKLCRFLIKHRIDRDCKEVNNKEYLYAKKLPLCSYKEYKSLSGSEPVKKNNIIKIKDFQFGIKAY